MADRRSPPAAASGDAASALEKLPVKGRAPKTGYDREQFGPAWSDVDRNGCDTRNDILKRDLAGETFKPGTHDCVVLTGTLSDPYTGKKITFSRGQGTSEAIEGVLGGCPRSTRPADPRAVGQPEWIVRDAEHSVAAR